MTYTVSTITDQETKKIGTLIASSVKAGDIFCVSGVLGAGKTTLISGLIHYFLPGQRVLSPTFTLVRTYSVHHPSIRVIYHMDLYRINDASDISHIGLYDMIHDPCAITIIEWPERLSHFSHPRRIDLSITLLDSTTRTITCSHDILRQHGI